MESGKNKERKFLVEVGERVVMGDMSTGSVCGRETTFREEDGGVEEWRIIHMLTCINTAGMGARAHKHSDTFVVLQTTIQALAKHSVFLFVCCVFRCV